MPLTRNLFLTSLSGLPPTAPHAAISCAPPHTAVAYLLDRREKLEELQAGRHGPPRIANPPPCSPSGRRPWRKAREVPGGKLRPSDTKAYSRRRSAPRSSAGTRSPANSSSRPVAVQWQAAERERWWPSILAPGRAKGVNARVPEFRCTSPGMHTRGGGFGQKRASRRAYVAEAAIASFVRCGTFEGRLQR